MAGFNGSGTYIRSYNWTQDAANAVPITASKFDTEMNGEAAALSICITRDGQGVPTANIPWGGFKITNLGTPTVSTDATTKGYVDGLTQPYYVDTGAVNTIAIASGIAGYVTGQWRWIKVLNTNTSTTVNLNDATLGNIRVKMLDGSDPAVGQIVATRIYGFVYNGTNYICVTCVPSTLPTGLTLTTGPLVISAGRAYTTTNTIAFSATPTVDASLSNVHEIGVLTANITTLTISNPVAGQTITIRFKQDGAGSHTVATPSGAKITGSVTPTASTACLLTLTYSAADTRWEGAYLGLPT
jgi:hypothetical protein